MSTLVLTLALLAQQPVLITGALLLDPIRGARPAVSRMPAP